MKTWKFEVHTMSPHTIDFKIVDQHHKSKFYGEWFADNYHDLDYHVEGVIECIDRGTYKSNEYEFNGMKLSSWDELEDQMYEYLDKNSESWY